MAACDNCGLPQGPLLRVRKLNRPFATITRASMESQICSNKSLPYSFASMRHKHGVKVQLQGVNGRFSDEYPNLNGVEPHKCRGLVGSRLVALTPGKPFQICITIAEDFVIYKADGLKIVVVVPSRDEEGWSVMRTRAWFIKIRRSSKEAEYTLSPSVSVKDSGVRNRASLVMPEPSGEGFCQMSRSEIID